MTAPRPAQPRPAPTARRRGGVYVLVLGVSTMLGVVGLSAVVLARTNTREVVMERDLASASVLARSAVQLACARLNADSAWRTTFISGTSITGIPLGAGQVNFRIVDEIDNNLSNDATQPVRVFGTARVGAAQRTYSVQLAPTPPEPLEVLRSPLHSNLGVGTNATVRASGGTISAAGALVNSKDLYADVEAGIVTDTGSIFGNVTTGVPPKTMPPANALSLLGVTPTTINYSSLTAVGTLGDRAIENRLLSSSVNPWGAANPAGVYRIVVPASRTLFVRSSRLSALLVVELGFGSSVEFTQLVWEPPSPALPSLITSGGNLLGGIRFDGGGPLGEPTIGVNLNPPTSPFEGASNTTTTDSFTPVYRGLFHITGAFAPVDIDSDAVFEGSLVSAAAVVIDGDATFTTLPSLIASPPAPYVASGPGMRIVRGTYRWETN
jgi:hypothetical protein